jgi:hypothetical protein
MRCLKGVYLVPWGLRLGKVTLFIISCSDNFEGGGSLFFRLGVSVPLGERILELPRRHSSPRAHDLPEIVILLASTF